MKGSLGGHGLGLLALSPYQQQLQLGNDKLLLRDQPLGFSS